MNISRPFIERPVATTLLMAGLALVGVAAFPFLPVAPLPQVDFPTILVSANLPGASPEIMASSVAQPLETQFSQIPGVSQMTSSSVLSGTQITLQFELDRNIDAAVGSASTCSEHGCISSLSSGASSSRPASSRVTRTGKPCAR